MTNIFGRLATNLRRREEEALERDAEAGIIRPGYLVKPAEINLEDLHNATVDTPRVLQASLEYGAPGHSGGTGVGGIGAYVQSASKSLPSTGIENRVILPFYESIQGPIDESYEHVGSIKHIFGIEGPDKSRVVESNIYKKTNADGVTVYYVKPADAELAKLFSSLESPTQIYSDYGDSKFIDRIAYFNSCVAAFGITGENLPPLEDAAAAKYVPDIVQGNGWGMSFLGHLLNKQKESFTAGKGPKSVYVAHSTHSSDGSYDIKDIPEIGLAPCKNDRVYLSKQTATGYDHLCYVSRSLLRETLSGGIYSPDVWQAYAEGRVSIILNNINVSEFNPCVPGNLPDTLTFDKEDIASGKKSAKEHLNSTLLASIGGKTIDPEKPMVLYVGRYSPEKGVSSLDTAIQKALEKGASFVCMGIGGSPEVRLLKEKYADNPNVVIIDNPKTQEEYRNIIRAAGDVYLVPSKVESCGIVPMEANITGAMVVAHAVGGLKDVVKPDANGALYGDDAHMGRALSIALDKWQELKDDGSLSMVQSLIQESAIKTFDWSSSTVGSAIEYKKIYEKILAGEEPSNITETKMTKALLQYLARPLNASLEPGMVDEVLYQRVVGEVSPDTITATNGVGLSPLTIARNLGDPVVEDRISELVKAHGAHNLRRPPLDGKTVVLNMLFEYKNTGFGGITTFASSLNQSIANKHSNVESLAIMPYYKWHDDLVDSGQMRMLRKTCTVDHMYNGQMIQSDVYEVMNDGEKQYLIRPADGYATDIAEQFRRTDASTRHSIYDKMHDKTCYLSSAVAAVCASGSPDAPRVDILNAHSWGGSLAISLLKKYYKAHYPKTVQTIHSEMVEQGVTSNPRALPEIGLEFASIPGDLSLLAAGLESADSVVYVSNELAKSAERPMADYSLDRVCRKIKEEGRAEVILNNISDHFDPTKEGYFPEAVGRVTPDNILAKKAAVKEYLNNTILPSLADPTLRTKKISDGPLFTYVGRYLPEKGIDALKDAVDEVLKAVPKGTFCIMGLTGNPEGDEIIAELKRLYGDDENVIILEEPKPEVQRIIGPYARFASDITFIPSHLESCGLVSMEAQLNGSMVVSSDVGGLNDTVFPPDPRRNPDDVTGFKYADRDKTSLRDNIRSAIAYLRSIDRESFAKRLHKDAKSKYVWSGEQGSLSQYLGMYDKLQQRGVHDYVNKSNINLTSNIRAIKRTDIIQRFMESGDKILDLDTSGMELDEKVLETQPFTGHPKQLIKTPEGDIVAIYQMTNNSSGILGKGALGKIYLGQIIYSAKSPHRIDEFIAVKEQSFPSTCSGVDDYLSERDVTLSQGGCALPSMNRLKVGGEYKTHFYLSLLDGQDVSKLNPDSLSLTRKMNILSDVSTSLQDLHSRDMLHLDLHKGNWFIDKETGKTKLIDFGTCVSVKGKEEIPIQNICSFAPPEVFDGIASKKTDVFSMGIEMSRLFSKELGLNSGALFVGPAAGRGELKEEFRYAQILNSEIPESIQGENRVLLSHLRSLLAKMVDPEPRKRPSILEASILLSSIKAKLYSNSQTVNKDYRKLEDVITVLASNEFCNPSETNLATIYSSRSRSGLSPLTWAAIENRYDIIKTLVESGYDINQLDANGDSAVKIAARYSNFNTLKNLWLSGANLDELTAESFDDSMLSSNIKELLSIIKFLKGNGFSNDMNSTRDSDGHTPLTFACSSNCDPEIIKMLVRHGSNPKAKNIHGMLPIKFALQNKSENALKITENIITMGGSANLSDINLSSRAGAINEDAKFIYERLYFLQKNDFYSKDLTKLNKKGHTIASFLISKGNISELEKMCDFAGANAHEIANAKTRYGYSSLFYTLASDNIEAFNLLRSKGANLLFINGNKTFTDRLASAVPKPTRIKEEFNSFVRSTIADWESHRADSTTPLLDAISMNRIDIAIAYISKYGIVRCMQEVDSSGCNMLDLALKHNCMELFHYALQKSEAKMSDIHPEKILVDLVGDREENARNLLSVLAFLEANNFSKDIKKIDDYHNLHGHTPLTKAIQDGDIDLVKALISVGANVNRRNSFGNTAMHIAIDQNNKEILSILMTHPEINLYLCNDVGISVKDFAYSTKNKSLIHAVCESVTAEATLASAPAIAPDDDTHRDITHLVDCVLGDKRGSLETVLPQRRRETDAIEADSLAHSSRNTSGGIGGVDL